MGDLKNDIQQAPFLFLADHPNQYFENFSDGLKAGFKQLNNMNIEASYVVRDAFFSARNIDIIQKWLIKSVLCKTNILINYQKIEHITDLMNAIYMTHGQNLPFALKEQIFELNSKVINLLVPYIINELYVKTRYLNKIESANYIEQPIFVGAKGQRTLPSTLLH